MTAKDNDIPAGSQQRVIAIDWATLLTSADIESLVGLFDTLIEMDFQAKVRNEQRSSDGTEKISNK